MSQLHAQGGMAFSQEYAEREKRYKQMDDAYLQVMRDAKGVVSPSPYQSGSKGPLDDGI